jgi:hypothetical protein
VARTLGDFDPSVPGGGIVVLPQPHEEDHLPSSTSAGPGKAAIVSRESVPDTVENRYRIQPAHHPR